MLPEIKCISVFKNVDPKSYLREYSVKSIVDAIGSGLYKKATDEFRALLELDTEAAKIYKSGQQDVLGRLVKPGNFLGATWSGIFKGGKKAKDLTEHSRRLCIDVDGLEINLLNNLKKQLHADPHTHVLFISPSGNGLKWVVKINLQQLQEHTLFFNQLSDYLHQCYKLTRKEDVPKGIKPQIDPQCKNVDRLCFLPHDPEVYYNPDSEVMPLLEEYCSSSAPVRVQEPSIELGPDHKTLEEVTQRLAACIAQLQQYDIDLTANREDWITIGFSLASLGEAGRFYYHQISRQFPQYTFQETEAKFDELLRNRNGQINIGTFFFLCQQALDAFQQDSKEEMTPSLLQEWAAPQPLTSPLLSVSSVSHSMLPEPIRPWLIDIANRMKCPLDFVASAAIVMISSLIGTRLSIKPKARDEWTITPNLWGAAIGDPSTMKTPSISEVYKPLNRLVIDARQQYEDALKQYEAEQITYEAQKKVYQSQEIERMKGKASGNPVGFPDPLQKPTERRYITNDATVEKLADLLNENPAGLLQFRDELTGLLAGWERQGREEDRAFYLEAWNGNGSKTVDRIGRGTIHVKNLCLSLFGGIQPVKLLAYLRAAQSYDNDGFVQRLQLAVYPDRPRWDYVDEYPDSRARDVAYQLIKQIAESDFSSIAYLADEYNRFPYTRFDPQAQEVFKQWLIHWETEVLPNECGLLLEHFTKYRSLIPSLALIFHVIHCLGTAPAALPTQKQLVSVDAIQMAVEWCTYLQSHARRIYGLLDTQSVESAKTLLTHLKAGHLKNGFKLSDVQRKGWSNLISLELIESAVAELVDRNWLKEIRPPATSVKAGRPEAPHYLIHPTKIQNT